MSLADFIKHNEEALLQEWENFARARIPTAARMSQAELRDHAAQLLRSIAEDITSEQSEREQTEKSRGSADRESPGHIGGSHGVSRMESGFSLIELVSEYRALRASVIRLWEKSLATTGVGTGREELTRFNEAIDQALTESVETYTARTNRVRELFLGMLGHDLRSPLSSIIVSASMALKSGRLQTKDYRAVARIVTSAERMERMVHELLDLTRSQLGTGIPVFPKELNLAQLTRLIVNELTALHPDRELRVEADENLIGLWDRDRIGQVISNLVGNAIQHGDERAPVTIHLREMDGNAVFSVHNSGAPIPPDAMRTIFEPMARGRGASRKPSSSLGLGLYIAREIVAAHGGRIEVTSTKEEGTTFTVRLPLARRADASVHT